jgi:hypothetical protein
VAAKTSSTTIAATPTTLSQSLNVLSSQQSATVLMGFYFPFRLTHWYGRTNWITFAPVAFGGFDTLLNPTATTATSANAGAVTSATTTNFSSVYNFRAGGARFAWDIYPRRTDEAPIEISWVNLTLGYYSNLPSWRCTAPAAPPGSNPTSGPTGKTYVPSPNNNTSCLAVGVVPPGSTGTSPSSYHLYESRTLVPRVGIAGELKLPNYPVVFGYIANLSQYGKFTGGNGIDSQNKPGNDVRFYFGLKVNAKDALKKLGVPSS